MCNQKTRSQCQRQKVSSNRFELVERLWRYDIYIGDSSGLKCRATANPKRFSGTLVNATRPASVVLPNPLPILEARKYTFVQHLPGK